MKRKQYETAMAPMREQLVAMARWARVTGQRIVVLFEGRDTAGKGGATLAYEQQPNAPSRCPTGVQFPVPPQVPEGYGYGDVPPVLITDKLKVPASLAKGDYVLSWRWDCEQTPQIWNTCADLTVV